MKEESNTYTLISFLSTLKYELIPPKVIRDSKIYILDTLGTSLVGSSVKGGDFLLECIGDAKHGTATVMGRRRKRSAEDAALINAYLAFYQELDSGHRLGGVHSACVIVPTALALAETERVSGKKFLEAVVAGTELYSRLGVASAKAQYARGNDPTGTASAIGAGAAAAKIIGLTEDETLVAVGIASSLTPLSPVLSILGGGMTKGLNNGVGARNGIIAGRLAKKGFTGCKDAILGKEGYLAVTTNGKFKAQALISDLGSKYEISNMYYKVHASCNWTHSAIDATLALREENPDIQMNTQAIKVRTFEEAVRMLSNKEPKDEIEAKFSLPYTVAVALIHGKVGVEEFSQPYLSDSRIRNLARQVLVIDDPDLRDAYPGKSRPAIIQIESRDGLRCKKRIDFPKGFPENPLSDDEIKAKFIGLSEPVIGREKCEAIIQSVDKLEMVDDMGIFGELLSK